MRKYGLLLVAALVAMPATARAQDVYQASASLASAKANLGEA